METRSVRYLAIAQLAGALVVALVGGVGGAFLQLELHAPGPAWSAAFYSRMLSLHGLAPLALGSAVLAGSLGYVAIGRLVGATRIPAPALGWVGFAVWVVGVGCSVIATQLPALDSGWTMYTPGADGELVRPTILYVGPFLIALAAVIYAVHLALVVLAHRAQDVTTAIATLLVGALALTGMGGLRDTFATIPPVYPSTAAFGFALGLATVSVMGDRPSSRIIGLITLGVVAGWAVIPHAVFALAIAGLWITLAVMGGFGRTAVAFVVFGAAPAIILLGFARGVLAVADFPLHDTTFAVGMFHAQMILVGCALLAGLHAWPAIARHPQPALLWLGACIANAGLLLHVIASLRVGSAGMPRRYWDYDPQFAGGHAMATWGAGIALAGVVVLVVAWIAGRRAPTP